MIRRLAWWSIFELHIGAHVSEETANKSFIHHFTPTSFPFGNCNVFADLIILWTRFLSCEHVWCSVTARMGQVNNQYLCKSYSIVSSGFSVSCYVFTDTSLFEGASYDVFMLGFVVVHLWVSPTFISYVSSISLWRHFCLQTVICSMTLLFYKWASSLAFVYGLE